MKAINSVQQFVDELVSPSSYCCTFLCLTLAVLCALNNPCSTFFSSLAGCPAGISW